MSKTKILFINTETDPYIQTGHLSELGRLLPQAMSDMGHDVRIFTPRFGIINERRHQLHEVIRLSGQNIIINEADHQLMLKVASLMPQRTQVYFIDNEEYFSSRKEFCDENKREYPDQAERALFYARGVIETVRKLHWIPDVVYCQGWFAATAAMCFKKGTGSLAAFKKCKIVFGLFDNAFKTPLPATATKIIKTAGVTKAEIADIKDKEVDYVALCKFYLQFCDGVIISEKISHQEIISYAQLLEREILDLSSKDDDIKQTFGIYSAFFDSFCNKEIVNKLENL